MKITICACFLVLVSVAVTAQGDQKCGANEQWFECESSSRELCTCDTFVRFDCNEGCQCKNGFCRKDGACVPRECKGSPYD